MTRRKKVLTLEQILREGIEAVKSWAGEAAATAGAAEQAVSAIAAVAQRKIAAASALMSDLTSGRLFTADKVVVDEVDLGAGGDPVHAVKLDVNSQSFLVYGGGDPAFKAGGKYRVVVVFQRTGTSKGA
jgi:hypothetical protein